MRQRGIVGIFVLVLILVVAMTGGAYYLGRTTTRPQVTKTNQATPTTPTPNPYREPDGSAATANWKTYTSSQFGLSFSYPNGVMVTESQYGLFLKFRGPNQGEGGLEDGFHIELSKKPLEIPLEKIVDKDAAEPKQYGQLIDGPSQTDLGKNRAYRFRAQGDSGYTYDSIYIPNGSSYWYVETTVEDYYNNNKSQYQKVVDQILSTFKFTSQ